MRASRLLRLLLLLQNQGRMTSAALARTLEVAPRTVLRDVDALTEAGLPVVVHAGYRGGIELGFDYRTRLTGLSADEAEALGVLLARPVDDLAPLGLAGAAARAREKLLESLPDPVREKAARGAQRFRAGAPAAGDEDDPRLPALAEAIRGHRIVRVHAHTSHERVVHPIALVQRADGWHVEDDREPGTTMPVSSCGDVNISARTFEPRTHAAAARPSQPRRAAQP